VSEGQQLRCDNGILFGILDGGIFKVKCRSKRCGARVGAVIIHDFDVHSGNLLSTHKYRDPARREGSDATQ
jgi:hypothetical protein